MRGEPEAVEQHGMAEGHVRFGEPDHLGPGQGARQLGDGHIGTAPRDEFDYFVEARRTAVEARLDAEPGRDVAGERGIEAGELAVRSGIVERRLVARSHGNDQFAAVEDSLDIWSPQIGSHSRYGADYWSWIGKRLRCRRGGHRCSTKSNNDHETYGR